MTDDAGWTTIESDPAVFTDLLVRMGVEGIEMDELYSLDDDQIALEPSAVYGLVFLFKHEGQVDRTVLGGSFTERTQGGRELFFAKQMVHNACATQALLNLLFNLDIGIQLGTILADFKTFVQDFDPVMRGEAIGASDAIRLAHNTYARNDPFHIERDLDRKEKEDAFHFITYLPVQGELIELDGLQRAPLSHGTFHGDDWIALARETIRKRIATYRGGELRFNLMSLQRDRRSILRDQLMDLEGRNTGDEERMKLMQLVSQEEEKRVKWAKENEWRRHSFLPLVVELLKALSRSGQLEQGIEYAKGKR